MVRAVALKYHHRGGLNDLDDLVVIGLAAVDRAASKFDPWKGCRFAHWAKLCVVQAVRNAVRCGLTEEAFRVDRQEMEEEEDREGVIDTTAEDRHIERLFWQDAMQACLTARQREVIKLRIWDQLSLRDIGEIIGVCREQVDNIYQRALKALRRHLLDIGYDAEIPAPL